MMEVVPSRAAQVSRFTRWCATAAVALLLAGCSMLDDGAPTFTQEIREQATSYLRTLPPDQKIYVWPSKSRIFTTVSDLVSVAQIVSGFYSQGGRPVEGHSSNAGYEIAIVYLKDDNNKDDVSATIANSKLLPSQDDFLKSANIAPDGCSGQISIDFELWIVSGIGVVSGNKLELPGSIERCVLALLDYANGFPVPNNRFDLEGMPPPEVRRAVMWAVRECTLSGRFNLLAPKEHRTRDGVAPFPTIDCIIESLGST